MLFNFEEFQKKYHLMTKEQLLKEWENYTSQIKGKSASSALRSPLKTAISLVSFGAARPRPQIVQEVPNQGPQYAESFGPQEVRPGLYTAQTWPQNNPAPSQDGQRNGPVPTPLVPGDVATSALANSVQGFYDQFNLHLHQDLMGAVPNSCVPSPEAGIFHTPTWPMTAEDTKALGEARRKLAKAQNMADRSEQSWRAITLQEQVSTDPQSAQCFPTPTQK